MSQIKLAAMFLMPLAFLCPVVSAQQQSDNLAKTTISSNIKPNTPESHEEVYGFYVPYTAPAKKAVPPEGAVASVPAACNAAPSPPIHLVPDPVYGAYVPYTGPPINTNSTTACYTSNSETPTNNTPPPNSSPVKRQQDLVKGSSQQPESANVPLPACSPSIQLQPDPVYGAYVPYTGPPIRVTACYTPNAQMATNNTLPVNSSPVPQPISEPTGNISQPLILPGGTAHPPGDDILAANATLPAGDPTGTGAAGSTSGFVRPVPPPLEVKKPRPIRPFRSIAIGFKANTLGAGFELATPVSRSFNLRTSINGFAFDDPFSIDGVNYDARLHLKSSGTTLDWFPGRHGFHISPGILYVKNTLSAPAFVGPGQTFVLGSQAFTNSVDDPVTGSASVIYPNKFAPMLLLGFGNIIPRSGRHLSVPFEFGVAYTGAPQINVILDGTACTTQGCVSFAGNAEAQTYVKQEVNILNEDLKKFPVFPIVSLGLAYHF